MPNATIRELFEDWPDNESEITGGFKGRKAKNVYPKRNRGELPICVFREETSPDGESGIRGLFPNRRAEFVVAETDSQRQLQAYSPKISLFAKEPKSDPDDAYFIVSATRNLKATLHKYSAHVKIAQGTGSPQKDRLIKCDYPNLDQNTPTPILRIAFPSFGLTGRSSLPTNKEGRLTHYIAKSPDGYTIVLDFSLHLLPVHDFYNYANARVVAVASYFRRYALVATVASTNTIEAGAGGLREQVLDQIQRRGKDAYRDMLNAEREVEGIFARCDDETKGPLMLIAVNNLRELIRMAFP